MVAATLSGVYSLRRLWELVPTDHGRNPRPGLEVSLNMDGKTRQTAAP